MQHICIEIKKTDVDTQDIILAQLADIGFNGFEENEGGLLAYIPADKYDKSMLLQSLQSHCVDFTETFIDEKNWNAVWESGFQPITILHPKTHQSFCTIRADFHDARTTDGGYDIVINPKMSFGTGHHATTYLMIQQMSEMDFKEKKVLDFGTGTGILAILAEKMNCTEVLAIDCDEWSINNAHENKAQNKCEHIVIRKQSTYEGSFPYFDYVLANINLHIVLEHLTSLFGAVKIGGTILISGILTQDVEGLKREIEKHHGIPIAVITRADWALIAVKRIK